MNGAWNLTTGTVGAIASVSYIAESGGTGAVLGGTVALQFSIGEMAIGTAQMMDAVFSKKTNDALQSSGSIPGLIAYGTGSKYAPFIDALGQFTPTMVTSSSVTGLVKNGFGIVDAVKTFDNTPNVKNAIGLLDQISDVNGATLETFNLSSDVVNGKLRQAVTYSLSYTVQKGDNLTSIAKKLKTTIDSLIKQNGLTKEEADKLDVGQKLKLSGATYGGGSGGGQVPR